MRIINTITIVAFALLLGSYCATNPVTKKKQVVFMSEAREIAMGQEADPQIQAQFGVYEDKTLQDFITEKGKKMAAISHRPKLDYYFRIVDSEILNAFAVPGGYVYFTRGIMAHFNNEAEFAGVLGHEIGHIAARHTVEQHRNQIAGQIGIIAGVVLAPELAGLAEPASQGLGLLPLKFGRDAERESDELGVEYSSKIGYDATEMAEFFQTLERKGAESGQGELPEFLSTHPNPGDRYKTVGELAKEWKKKLNLTDAQVNRNVYLKRIEGLIYGEDPRQGYRENDVFYHPTLKFRFDVPAGWQYQNTPAQVQLASRDGKAMLMLRAAKGASPQEAANGFVQQNNLQAIDAREVTVNGLEAVAVLAESKPQEGQQQPGLRTLSYFIRYGDLIYMLLGAAGTADFENYTSVFSKSGESFMALSDVSKINKKPERIRVKTVSTAASLQQVLASHKVDSKRMEEHAILNGMQLTDRVEAGTLVKVVQE